jgi:hypothetical protein
MPAYYRASTARWLLSSCQKRQRLSSSDRLLVALWGSAPCPINKFDIIVNKNDDANLLGKGKNSLSNAQYDGAYFTQGGEVTDANGLPRSSTPPRHLLVIGNGRGGTTATASLVQALGFEAGETNPYLENIKLKAMVDSGATDAVLAALTAWPKRGKRMFWKDTRVWATKFDPVLEQLPLNVGVIVVFRDPLNIAARNAVLEGFDFIDEIERAARATRKLALRLPLLKSRQAAFVSYEKLLTNPAKVANALAQFVGVTDQGKIDRAIAVIEPSPKSYQDHFKSRAAPR